MSQYRRVKQYLKEDLRAQEGETFNRLPFDGARQTSFILPNLKTVIISHDADGGFEAFYQSQAGNKVDDTFEEIKDFAELE